VRWSEDEDAMFMAKNHNLTKPTLGRHIRAWNRHGEKFSGEVIDIKTRSKTLFKIREHKTSAKICVDLGMMNNWKYIAEPKPGDNLSGCLYASLGSGTRDAEECVHFEYLYLLDDEQYYEYG